MGNESRFFWHERERQAHIREYLARTRAGDTDGANEYFSRNIYGPVNELVGVVGSKMHPNCQTQIEDYRQTAICEILKALPRYDSTRAKASSWLWSIAKFHALTVNSKNSKRAERNVSLESFSEEAVSALLEAQAHDSTSLDFEALHKFFVDFWTPERLMYHFRGKALKVVRLIVEMVSSGHVKKQTRQSAKGYGQADIVARSGVSRPLASYAISKLTGLTAKAWTEKAALN